MTPGSLAEFSNSLPSHGHLVDKASELTAVLGDGENKAPGCRRGPGLPSRHLSFVMLLAFEGGRLPPQKPAVVLGEIRTGFCAGSWMCPWGGPGWAGHRYPSQALARKPDRNTLCRLLLFLSLALRLTTYTF